MFSQTQANAAAAAKVSHLMEKPRQQTPAPANSAPFRPLAATVCCPDPVHFLCRVGFFLKKKKKEAKQNDSQSTRFATARRLASKLARLARLLKSGSATPVQATS